MFKWFRKKEENRVAPLPENSDERVRLKGRTISRDVAPILGISILELADRNKVDWQSNCKRGTCARCRCLVVEGMEFLSEPNANELDRLEEEEIKQGYRLGCQAKLETAGAVSVKHSPYWG